MVLYWESIWEPCVRSCQQSASARTVITGECLCSSAGFGAAESSSGLCWGCGACMGKAPRRFSEAPARSQVWVGVQVLEGAEGCCFAQWGAAAVAGRYCPAACLEWDLTLVSRGRAAEQMKVSTGSVCKSNLCYCCRIARPSAAEGGGLNGTIPFGTYLLAEGKVQSAT